MGSSPARATHARVEPADAFERCFATVSSSPLAREIPVKSYMISIERIYRRQTALTSVVPHGSHPLQFLHYNFSTLYPKDTDLHGHSCQIWYGRMRKDKLTNPSRFLNSWSGTWVDRESIFLAICNARLLSYCQSSTS